MFKKSFAKKCFSLILAASLFVSGLSISNPIEAQAASSNDYNLQEDIQDGNILHCFDWKYKDIEAEIPAIAAAGFSTVQTSPAQAAEGDIWYMLYQPQSFSVGTNNLGTKQELQSLINTAHKYGVNVMVDAVTNHLRGEGNTWDGTPAEYAKNNHPEYWHYPEFNASDWTSRYHNTFGKIGMCDINSENQTIINAVKSYMEELNAMGVDGVRWDTAKHIALPSEDFGSKGHGGSYWPTVTSVGDMYDYGEILDGPCNGAGNNDALMKEYTNYMSVTDDGYSSNVLNGVNGGNASWISTVGNYTTRGISKDKLVYWAESHDTYSNSEDGSSGSFNYSQNVMDRTYAIVGSQLGASALYFSRPSATKKKEIKAGVKGSTNFKNASVTAVNLFHNAMVDQAEYDVKSNDNKAFAVTRGNGSTIGGATIVLCGSNVSSQTVTVPNGDGNKKALVPVGTYKDKVTGNEFTVTKSSITGKVGSSGIAVIYTSEPQLTITADKETQSFDNSISVNFTITNADSYTVKVNGVESNKTSFTFTETSEVEITAKKGTKEVTKTFTYTKNIVTPTIKADPESTTFSKPLTVNYTIKADTYEIKANGVVNNDLTQTYTDTTEVEINATLDGQELTKKFTYTYKDVVTTTLYLDASKCSWFKNDNAVAAIKTNLDSAYTKMSTVTVNGKTYYTCEVSDEATSAKFARMLPNGNVYNEKSVKLSSSYNTFTSDSNWSTLKTSVTGTIEYKTPTITLSLTSGTYTEAINVKITVADAESASYTINGSTKSFTGSTTVNVSKTATLSVHAVNGDKTADASADYVIELPPVADTMKLYFTNNYNFNNVKAYYWGGSAEKMNWPGKSMTYVKQNEYNQAVYMIEVPTDITGIIFSDNGGNQTVDIKSNLTNGTGFYLNGNSGGKNTVGTYTFK